MEKSISMDKMYETLMEMRKEMDVLKSQVNNMVDTDTVLTSEEEEELEKTLEEYKQGKTHSLEDIEKDRENA